MKTEKYIFKNECLPVKVEEGIVYICKPEAVLHLKCPCGCGDIISLPCVDQPVHPNWQTLENTIIPSIQRTVGCKSHFTITNGIVKFHK